MIYYHLTTKENAAKIKKYGLRPFRGKRADQIGEEREGIFLCEEKDVPYWSIVLNLDYIVKIEGLKPIKKTDDTYFNYTNYAEWVYDGMISPEKLKVRKLRKDTKRMKDANKILAESYLWDLSNFVLFCAKAYNYDRYDKDSILYMANAFDLVLPSLDYSVFETEELKDILRHIGDGNYAFTDMYLDTGRTLWEQLIKYPWDYTFEARKRIYEYINRTFGKKLKGLNTGGWTG